MTADEAFFNSERGRQTYHADDLKPDVVTRELNKVFTKETGKDEWHFNSSASANGNLMGLLGGGFSGSLSGSKLREFLKEHNIETDISENKIIAKSIQLQQVNIADFVSKFNFAMEFRNISGSAKQNLKTVIFGEPVGQPQVSGATTFSSIVTQCPNSAALLLN